MGGMTFVPKQQNEPYRQADVNPFNATEVGLMKQSWLDPVRPVEDPLANKKWISKRQRGFVKENDAYNFAAVNEKHVDKFQLRVRDNIEEKATQSFLNKQPESSKITYATINPVFKYYSNYEFDK